MRTLTTVLVLVVSSLAMVPPASALQPTARTAPNGRIAYSTGAVLPDPDTSAHSQVFTIRPDGSGRRQLTHVAKPAQAGDPAYSPNARRIAYVSSVSGRFQVWLMHADGTQQHRLVSDPKRDDFLPRWAPDGKHLVFSRCTAPYGAWECRIARVRADGSHLRLLTGKHWLDFDARYAPDGKAVAFTTTRSGLASAIWQMRADGSVVRRLTPARPEAFWPDYSPDGTTILYSNNFDRPNSDLFTMDRHGRHVHRLTDFAPGRQGDFSSYSPDGRHIVFDYSISTASTYREGVAVMNADGTHVRMITRTGTLTIADWGVRR